MKVRFFVLFVFGVSLFSCKQQNQEANLVDLDSIDLSDKVSILNVLDSVGNGIPIFYNMYLSVELSSLFETAGVVFDKEKLNGYDKGTQYVTSYKKALNLGVYAVDLSYCRAFEQYEVAGRYFGAMQNLSEQLGIPQDYFEETAQRFEKNLTHKDSLISIANEIYYETEVYLKENERFAAASAIVLGGWVEAIYIGNLVAIESGNPDIIERIIDQKYSLNNLLVLLADFEDNEMINEYIVALKVLRDKYSGIKIEIPADFDATDENSKAVVAKWLVEIEKLQSSIKKIRESITE